jgi:hypothetical protein
VLVPVVFEEYQDQKLMLGVDLFRIFTGIWGNPDEFTTDSAAWTNLIFGLVDFLIVSFHFDDT